MLNLFKTMAKKIETYHQILYYRSNKLSPPMPSPKSYQKYSLSFSSSPSLSEQCNPNTLNGARQSGHPLRVGSEDGPEQSITADLEWREDGDHWERWPVTQCWSPNWVRRASTWKGSPTWSAKSGLRRASWHRVLDKQLGIGVRT